MLISQWFQGRPFALLVGSLEHLRFSFACESGSEPACLCFDEVPLIFLFLNVEIHPLPKGSCTFPNGLFFSSSSQIFVYWPCRRPQNHPAGALPKKERRRASLHRNQTLASAMCTQTPAFSAHLKRGENSKSTTDFQRCSPMRGST